MDKRHLSYARVSLARFLRQALPDSWGDVAVFSCGVVETTSERTTLHLNLSQPKTGESLDPRSVVWLCEGVDVFLFLHEAAGRPLRAFRFELNADGSFTASIQESEAQKHSADPTMH